MSEETQFDQYAIVEVFGHVKLAGRVSERVIAGQGFIQVDIPEVNGQPAFSRIYGPSAIYSITPVTEEIALRAASSLRERPVKVYMSPAAALLPEPDWVNEDEIEEWDNDRYDEGDRYDDEDDDEDF